MEGPRVFATWDKDSYTGSLLAQNHLSVVLVFTPELCSHIQISAGKLGAGKMYLRRDVSLCEVMAKHGL
jgi:hypothetical protein